MKKMIKKIAAVFMAFALVAAGMLAVNKAEVKAAPVEGHPDLYVNGGFIPGWNWDDANVGILTSSDGDTYVGEITVSGSCEIVISTMRAWGDGDAGKLKYIYNGGEETFQTEVTFANAGTYELTYVKSTKILTVVPKSTVTVNWTYEYYIAGPAGLGANDWAGAATAAAGKMTESAGKYVLTTTATGTGAEYCVVKYGISDNDSVANTTDWLKDPSTTQNFAIGDTVVAGAKLVFTFNPADGTCTVVVTPPADEEETTTAAEEDDDDEETTTTVADDDDEETTTTVADEDDDETTTAADDEDDDETTTAADEDTNTYHVVGAEGLCGVNWDPSKNQMTKNADGTWSIKFTDVKAGKYEFKIATNGAWDNGEYNLEGDASSGGANAVIEVAKDGSTVIISFDGTKASITMNEVPAGAGDDTPAGENSMVAIFAILAVLAAAGVVTVVVAKRRAIEE